MAAQPKPAPFDVEKAQNVIFQPNPGPQTDFLSAPEQESLYGGSAGSGKSYAMLADPLRGMNNPNFRGIIFRRTNDELRELKSVSKNLWPKAIPGIKWSERDSQWTSPAGATFWMTYLDKDDDVTRYQGQAFCVAEDTEVLTSESTSKKVQDIRVGDEVMSLEGRKKVKWVSGPQMKKSVKVSFYSFEGHLLAEQIQPDSHPIALLSSKPYRSHHDLCQSTEKQPPYPLQWLSYKHLEYGYLENREISSSQEDGQSYCTKFERDNQAPVQPRTSFYLGVRYAPSLPSDEDRVPTQFCTFCKSSLQSLDSSPESSGNGLDQKQRSESSRLCKDHNNGLSVSDGGVGVQLEKQTNGDSLTHCSVCSRQYDELLLSKSKDGLDAAPSPNGVEGLDPGGLPYGEKGCTPLRIRYPYKTYNHPYTQEQRDLKVPLELCIVRVEPLDSPHVVYDLNVSTANSYITLGGIVNRNCWVGFDELTQWPTPYAWDYMRSRLRTADPTLSLYQRATTNPGGAGHGWVKKMFIDPAPWGEAFWATDLETGKTLMWPKGHSKEGEPLFKRRFIPAKLKDNPYLAADGIYEANLLALPERQRNQLLYGDWDTPEGAAFTEWNREIHTCDPFLIPLNWPKFRACDYGYGSKTAVLWFAVAPDGQLIVYRELYTSKVTAVDLAGMILEREYGEKIRYGMLDSSLWHNRGDIGPSLAEQMIAAGCHWRPSDRSKGTRVSGKNELHRRLQVDQYTNKPGIVFFNTCKNITQELPMIPLDKNNPEDVDTKSKIDHGYDALRYGIMSRPKVEYVDDLFSSTSIPETPSDQTFGY